VRIVGLCGQNWNRKHAYSFALRSVKACVRNVVKYLTTVDCRPRDHSACIAWPAVGTGQWPLGTNSAQFTVYRLRHTCPTARTAARPIPEGMTIFCLVSFTTGAVRSAMPATAGLLVWLWHLVGVPYGSDRQTDRQTDQCITLNTRCMRPA